MFPHAMGDIKGPVVPDDSGVACSCSWCCCESWTSGKKPILPEWPIALRRSSYTIEGVDALLVSVNQCAGLVGEEEDGAVVAPSLFSPLSLQFRLPILLPPEGVPAGSRPPILDLSKK